jgi:hypothetical protein
MVRDFMLRQNGNPSTNVCSVIGNFKRPKGLAQRADSKFTQTIQARSIIRLHQMHEEGRFRVHSGQCDRQTFRTVSLQNKKTENLQGNRPCSQKWNQLRLTCASATLVTVAYWLASPSQQAATAVETSSNMAMGANLVELYRTCPVCMMG